MQFAAFLIGMSFSMAGRGAKASVFRLNDRFEAEQPNDTSALGPGDL